MRSTVESLTEEVRARVRREGINLRDRTDLADALVRDAVRGHNERALAGDAALIDDERETTRRVLASLTGFGVLQPYLDDPDVEEIWINRGERVFIARHGRTEPLDLRVTPHETRDLVERMLASSGRRVDLSSPFVDASLPDGSRLHVASGDVARGAMSVNIRKFASRIGSLHALVELGSLSHQAATFLSRAVSAGLNVLVSGATHTGKTTLLNALIAAGPDLNRVVTVEETYELNPSVRDIVALQCRQPSLEGTGEITLRRLVKESLRMRPDLLVVGEVREAEALDLLIAMNSGVAAMCSIHANSARDALQKLTTLPLLAGRNIDAAFVVPTIAASVDLVIHCALDARGNRKIVEILAPTGAHSGHTIEASAIFVDVHGLLRATGTHPSRVAKFQAAGLDVTALLARDDA